MRLNLHGVGSDDCPVTGRANVVGVAARCRRVLGLVFVVAGLGACVEPASPRTEQASSTLTIVPVTASTAPSHDTATDSDVISCVDLVVLKVEIGDPFWSAHWDSLGADRSALLEWCGAYVLENPDAPATMHQEYLNVERFLQAATVTTPAPSLPTTSAEIRPLVSIAPPTQPPVAADPSGGQCDPNYGGCVPIDSDVDCAGGTGDGPSYTDGPVAVIGRDVYDLDRNHDGWACE